MDTSTNPYLVTNVGAGLTGYAMSDLADISLPTGLVPTQVACLGVSTCVLGTISSINKVYCFGKNTEGQLGILASGNIGDGAGEMGTNLGHVDDVLALMLVNEIVDQQHARCRRERLHCHRPRRLHTDTRCSLTIGL